MTTFIRPEVSKKKDYWISKHRYYELKHFCLQYPEWQEWCNQLNAYGKSPAYISDTTFFNAFSNPTERNAQIHAYLRKRMELVEQAAIAADPDIASYILKAVTNGLSYNYIKTRMDIPCSRDTFYDRYRKFFWYLSNTRQ